MASPSKPDQGQPEMLAELRTRYLDLLVAAVTHTLYESMMDGLRSLYPRLQPGGFLIVDDYGFDNCRAAVEDYRREHEISEPIERIDRVGAFWRRRA